MRVNLDRLEALPIAIISPAQAALIWHPLARAVGPESALSVSIAKVTVFRTVASRPPLYKLPVAALSCLVGRPKRGEDGSSIGFTECSICGIAQVVLDLAVCRGIFNESGGVVQDFNLLGGQVGVRVTELAPMSLPKVGAGVRIKAVVNRLAVGEGMRGEVVVVFRKARQVAISPGGGSFSRVGVHGSGESKALDGRDKEGNRRESFEPSHDAGMRLRFLIEVVRAWEESIQSCAVFDNCGRRWYAEQ